LGDDLVGELAALVQVADDRCDGLAGEPLDRATQLLLLLGQREVDHFRGLSLPVVAPAALRFAAPSRVAPRRRPAARRPLVSPGLPPSRRGPGRRGRGWDGRGGGPSSGW